MQGETDLCPEPPLPSEVVVGAHSIYKCKNVFDYFEGATSYEQIYGGLGGEAATYGQIATVFPNASNKENCNASASGREWQWVESSRLCYVYTPNYAFQRNSEEASEKCVSGKPDVRIQFKSIAEGWRDTGMSMDYCPFFLRAVAGECQSRAGGTGCAYAAGASGLFQLDATRTFFPARPPTPALVCGDAIDVVKCTEDGIKRGQIDLNNPCSAAHIAMHMFVQQTRWPETWNDKEMGRSILEDLDLPKSFGYNGTCFPLPLDGSGSPLGSVSTTVPTGEWQKAYDKPTTCNFIGPFCHRGTVNNNNSRFPCFGRKEGDCEIGGGGACGWDKITGECYPARTMWNGGGNDSQGPFTCYSDLKLLEYNDIKLPNGLSEACRTTAGALGCSYEECTKISLAAIEEAKKICDSLSPD